MFHDAKKGQRVVKVVDIHGVATASIQIIAKVSIAKGLVYTDAGNIDDEGVSTYRMDNGRPTDLPKQHISGHHPNHSHSGRLT